MQISTKMASLLRDYNDLAHKQHREFEETKTI